jgi:hypothetical protein
VIEQNQDPSIERKSVMINEGGVDLNMVSRGKFITDKIELDYDAMK